MRTITVTLPDEQAAILEQEAKRQHKPLDAVISSLLQNALQTNGRYNVVDDLTPDVQPDFGTRTDGIPAASPAAILASIAAMPIEGATDEFSGEDHDSLLYGRREH